jgi:polyferredoxin
MVMHKVNRPARLIGFKSEEQIIHQKEFTLGNRLYAYSAILLILASTLTVLLIKRSDIGTRVLRASGTLYQLREDGTVSNLYNAELINKTSRDIAFEIQSDDPSVKFEYINRQKIIRRGENVKVTFFIIRPQKMVNSYKSDLSLQVISDGKTVGKANTTFIAPAGSF